MEKIRVLVIEDSLTVRKRLVEVISEHPSMEVVGEAADGKRGVELCAQLRPSVVTIDMMMPVMDGLAATEHIMAYSPTPIVVISASSNRGEVFSTFDAIAAGAVEFVEKPAGDEQDDVWERRLLSTLRVASRIKVITHIRGRLRHTSAAIPRVSTSYPVTPLAPASVPAETGPRTGPPRVLAIGASTGGPAAIQEILRQLPATYPLPILFVLHIGQNFANTFAQWLNDQSKLKVTLATDGQPLPAVGTPGVWMAPPNRHMVVSHGHLRLTDGPERHSCKPSVDSLFESVAAELGAQAVGCLLTGMGKDGAAGLLAMKQAGANTIAQDEASSVVYGMPREAVILGAARHVLPLSRIPAMLESFAGPPSAAASGGTT